MQVFDRSLFGVAIADEPDLYRASSPITYVERVTAPVLVTAGENDPRCPVRQIDLYVEALRARGHDVEYERSQSGHGLYDVDLRVDEARKVMNFLAATNPV
jgi:dipeptidyl aminopeptidase/acylaminoacyl peptidase